MIALGLSPELLRTKFGTNSFEMKLIPSVTDALAGKQVHLMSHYNVPVVLGVLIYCRLYQIRKSLSSCSLFEWWSSDSIPSERCWLGTLWTASHLFPRMVGMDGWSPWDVFVWANHQWALFSLSHSCRLDFLVRRWKQLGASIFRLKHKTCIFFLHCCKSRCFLTCQFPNDMPWWMCPSTSTANVWLAVTSPLECF